ncbi:hypothetical protein [Sphingomonas sp. Leaf339]|uniref:hypothetical protein n=1 Tax=Sphingomonas sp. Leaf339 TaxID=1736343 RepID=UPI0012E33488|nr:hypothetical protein [Sphingomonas sp. Leaf339]
MENETSKFEELRPNDIDRQDNKTGSMPLLQMRPQHFFSNRFDVEIIEEPIGASIQEENGESQGWLGRIMELNLFLLIVFVGIPVLAYCILSSSR